MLQTDWGRCSATARAVLSAHDGAAPLQAFVLAGLTVRQVAALFRQGVLHRPRIGWYCDPGLPWQAGPAVRVGGAATCISSAGSWGLPVPHDDHPKVHVSLERNAGRLRHSRDRTWSAAAGTDETAHLHWAARVDPAVGWRVSIVDTLLQLADCVPPDWFVAAMDAALHRSRDGERLLSAAQLALLTQHLPIRLRSLLDLVDPRAESCIETLLRLGLIRRGLRGIELQVWATPRDRVDLLIRGKVILEADGEEFHDPARDALRDARLRALGYLVLRFSYDRIVHDLDAVLDEIEAALAAL